MSGSGTGDFHEVVATNKKTLLYVGGLDAMVDDETLTNTFIAFGELASVLVPKDEVSGKHRGFGFVEFEEPEDAKNAMDNMNDAELFGRVIKCNLANPKAARAQAVWADADKWMEKTLKGDAKDVDAEIRQQGAAASAAASAASSSSSSTASTK